MPPQKQLSVCLFINKMIKISQTNSPAIGVLYSGGGRENFRRDKPRGRETAGNSQGKDDIKYTSSLAAMCIVLLCLLL
jgi:hypothetical protein